MQPGYHSVIYTTLRSKLHGLLCVDEGGTLSMLTYKRGEGYSVEYPWPEELRYFEYSDEGLDKCLSRLERLMKYKNVQFSDEARNFLEAGLLHTQEIVPKMSARQKASQQVHPYRPFA